jgi:hypothetical protein
MKVIYTEHIKKDSFAETDEAQNKALYSLKAVLAKLNKEYSGVLKQKQISVELVKEKDLHLPLDFFSPHPNEAGKLLLRVNNSWLMNDICSDLFKLFENYELNFGECYNKLRLMLDFA